MDPAPDAALKAATLQRLRHREATIVVIGLGYVGLSLAVALAGAGHTVVGVDRDDDRVADVNDGRSPIEDIGSTELAALVGAGRLRATGRASEAHAADVVVIAVPTPVDDHRVPDLSAVREALAATVPLLRAGALVVLESTTYPGTTEELVVPALAGRGLQPGRDVFVGYSPERIDPANRIWRLANIPKIVAGLTPDCLDVTVALYRDIVEHVVPVSSLRTAEIAKLFENIFRAVNIALVNEFHRVCDGFGVDVWEVLDACATKPHGFMPFSPGPGLGGHCVPVDPYYLTWKARARGVATELIDLAGRINDGQPAHVVASVARILNGRRRALNGARVALLGVAYKRNVSDVRETPAVPIIEQLSGSGAEVTYHDPNVPEIAVGGLVLRSQALTATYLGVQDCVVIVTDHDAIDWSLVTRHAPSVLDTRNALGRQRPVVLSDAAEAMV